MRDNYAIRYYPGESDVEAGGVVDIPREGTLPYLAHAAPGMALGGLLGAGTGALAMALLAHKAPPAKRMIGRAIGNPKARMAQDALDAGPVITAILGGLGVGGGALAANRAYHERRPQVTETYGGATSDEVLDAASVAGLLYDRLVKTPYGFEARHGESPENLEFERRR